MSAELTEEEQTPAPEIAEPKISCNNCIHKPVCYWLTQLHTLAEGMKMSKMVELPFSPTILAIKCTMFEMKKKEEFKE